MRMPSDGSIESDPEIHVCCPRVRRRAGSLPIESYRLSGPIEIEALTACGHDCSQASAVHSRSGKPPSPEFLCMTRDGRFLINTDLDSTAAPITLLQHWQPEAKK